MSESPSAGKETAGNRDDYLDSRWKIAREVIEHEGNLKNQRTGSLLTLQGFLFAAHAIVLNAAIGIGADKKL